MNDEQADAGPPGPAQAAQDSMEMLRAQLLNPRAIIDSAAPPILFVSMYSLTSLSVAAAAACASGVAIALYRYTRRHEIRQAITGIAGVGIAVLVALATGRASNYFVPGVISGAIVTALLLGSALFRRPLSTLVAQALEGNSPEFYRAVAVRRSHIVVTLAWAAVTGARTGYRAFLIAQDRPTALGVTTVLLGWPVTVALVIACIAFLRWRGHGGRRTVRRTDEPHVDAS